MGVLVLERGRGVEVNSVVGGELGDELVDLPLKFYGLLKNEVINLEVKEIARGAPLQAFDQLRKPSNRCGGYNQRTAPSVETWTLTGTSAQSRHCPFDTSRKGVE